MDRARCAADVGVPDLFNAAIYFVDCHVREGRGASIAIECGDERVTHDALLDMVNRFGSALRDRLEVRPEERVVLLLLDTPAFAVAFFGAIKIGAVPIPTNTLWKPPDYRYVLKDSRARVAVVSEALLPQLAFMTFVTPLRSRRCCVGTAPAPMSTPSCRCWRLTWGTYRSYRRSTTCSSSSHLPRSPASDSLAIVAPSSRHRPPAEVHDDRHLTEHVGPCAPRLLC
jgi:non-ribosomal peptide synthetase component F